MDGEYEFNNADIINYVNAVIFQFDKHYALLQCVYETLSHIKEKIISKLYLTLLSTFK